MWKNHWFYFIVNDKNIQLAGRAINHLKTTDFNCINYKSHRLKMMSENFSESLKSYLLQIPKNTGTR